MTRRSLVMVALAVLSAGLGTERTGASQARGRTVFVGTYTGGTTGSRGIYAYRFDEATGALTRVGLAAESPSPSFLTASRDGRVVFAVNELDSYGGSASGSVTSFAVDPTGVTLTPLSVQSSRGAHPCHLALDRTGRLLAVANYTGGTFTLLRVGEDGRLAPPSAVVGGAGRGPRPEQAGPHAHAVWFSADNRFLVGADLGLDRLFIFRVDAAQAALTPHAVPSLAMAPGAGPRHLAVHPDGRRAFVINELNATITSLAWDATTGTFTAGASVPTRPAGVAGGDTAEVHVHPNGRVVYGSNRGHDSIAVFRIAADGSLTLVEHESTRGRTPRNFEIDPSGRWIIAANQDSNSLAVFRIDPESGALTPVGSTVEAPSPVSILFMGE